MQSMPDVQTNEISEVVRTIHHTEHGQQELQHFFKKQINLVKVVVGS